METLIEGGNDINDIMSNADNNPINTIDKHTQNLNVSKKITKRKLFKKQYMKKN